MIKVVVVTYGFDYGHVYTLGVYKSMHYAKKALEENKYLLADYHYISKLTYILGETYI